MTEEAILDLFPGAEDIVLRLDTRNKTISPAKKALQTPTDPPTSDPPTTTIDPSTTLITIALPESMDTSGGGSEVPAIPHPALPSAPPKG